MSHRNQQSLISYRGRVIYGVCSQQEHPRERSERGSRTAGSEAEPSAFSIDVFAPSGSPEANPRRKKVALCIQQGPEELPSTCRYRGDRYRASVCHPIQHRFPATGQGYGEQVDTSWRKRIRRSGETTSVLPLQAVPGIPELFIIAMFGTVVVGAVFLGLKLIQSLTEFREGYRQP